MRLCAKRNQHIDKRRTTQQGKNAGPLHEIRLCSGQFPHNDNGALLQNGCVLPYRINCPQGMTTSSTVMKSETTSRAAM